MLQKFLFQWDKYQPQLIIVVVVTTVVVCCCLERKIRMRDER
jgi:hypothetical protein